MITIISTQSIEAFQYKDIDCIKANQLIYNFYLAIPALKQLLPFHYKDYQAHTTMLMGKRLFQFQNIHHNLFRYFIRLLHFFNTSLFKNLTPFIYHQKKIFNDNLLALFWRIFYFLFSTHHTFLYFYLFRKIMPVILIL